MSLKMAVVAPKPVSRIPHIKGTKPSIQNAQLLISTGVPSLDYIFGGGLPMGSTLLIEEDTYGNYSESILKYFLAEGIVTSQSILVASKNQNPSALVSKVPALITEPSDPKPNQVADPMKMEIAWRYQNLKMVDSSPTGDATFGHFFDLTKQMDPAAIESTDKTFWDGEQVRWEAEAFKNSDFVDLLKTIRETVKKGGFSLNGETKPKNVLRIAIHSFGSRMWLCDEEKDTHSDLLKFFYYLRAILKNSFAVAVITFPAHFYDNMDCLVERLEHCSDFAIHLESFAGSAKETNPIFKDYHGLIHVKKIAAINSLKPHKPHSLDLAFKMRRKKFLIEVLHLPPELGDSSQREQDDFAPSSSGCSSAAGRTTALDF